MEYCFLSFVVILCIIIDKLTALDNVVVNVPRAVERGEDANFICSFNLFPEQILYSVKWYKGRREFYRFSPNEIPPIKTFPVQGISVFRSISNATHMTLRAVEPTISGKYSCEVSVDSPVFDTTLVTAEMDVVDLPRTKPKIADINKKYRIGDILFGNCTSFNSRPAANITWLINDKVIDQHSVLTHDSIKNETTGLETITLGLFLTLRREHFVRGKAKVTCVATLFNVYNATDERVIEEDRDNMIELYGPIGASLYDSDSKDAFMTHLTSAASPSPASTTATSISSFYIITCCVIICIKILLRMDTSTNLTTTTPPPSSSSSSQSVKISNATTSSAVVEHTDTDSNGQVDGGDDSATEHKQLVGSLSLTSLTPQLPLLSSLAVPQTTSPTQSLSSSTPLQVFGLFMTVATLLIKSPSNIVVPSTDVIVGQPSSLNRDKDDNTDHSSNLHAIQLNNNNIISHSDKCKFYSTSTYCVTPLITPTAFTS